MDKISLRKQMKYARNNLTEYERNRMDIAITNNVMSVRKIAESRVDFVYKSFKSEVDTNALIMRLTRNRVVYLPVVEGDEMLAVEMIGEKTKFNSYGIEEPYEYQIGLQPIEVSIIPLLACDVNGNRIGYGKGYYDKFLAKNPCYKVGICYDFQIVDSIDADKNDIPLDMIISEKRIIRIKRS